MAYNLELDKVISTINREKPKTVCIQLPDGLKPKAAEIQHEVESKTKAKVYIWLGSCYGSCDFPDLKGIDLLIQFGHSEWK